MSGWHLSRHLPALRGPRGDAPRATVVGRAIRSFLVFVLLGGAVACEPPAMPAQHEGECWACHGDRWEAAGDPDHAGLHFPKDCEACHRIAGWLPATLTVHPEDGSFPLLGRHRGLDCATCHGADGYRGLSATCDVCHAADYDATAAPDHAALGFPRTCRDCHGFDGWRPARGVPHEVDGPFPLIGGHGSVACGTCHDLADFSTVPRTCVGCHRADYDAASAPDHLQAGFPTTCDSCHSIAAWRPAIGALHEPGGAFPLEGGHGSVACTRCHVGSDFAATATTCGGCHAEDHRTADDPDHVAIGFPQNCEACHTIAGWEPARGGAHRPAGTFPLDGAHRAEACGSCHEQDDYEGLSPACVTCHRPAYDATTRPAHGPEGIPTACEGCHTTVAWTPWTGTVHTAGGAFPLEGAHATTGCGRCHGGGDYASARPECVSCHRPDYERTTDPDHVAQTFPTACEGCHSTTAWTPASGVAHIPGGPFPLVGGHAGVACARCHDDGVYEGKSNRCQDCHRADYDETTAPAHVTEQIPLECADCHTIAAWTPAPIAAHAADGAFPLTGAHGTTGCGQCHEQGIYGPLASACRSCHQDDYDGSNDPDHAIEQIPLACADCHTTTAWTPAPIDAHVANGAFPLTGAHETAGCGQCHEQGDYGALAAECRDCHRTDYDGSADPDHAIEQIPLTCADCHTTAAWEPAPIASHAEDGTFALTGAHETAGCGECHEQGDYGALAAACAECHRDDYDGSAEPAHEAEQIPLTCADCHTTTAWEPAPIAEHEADGSFALTGAHETTGCGECHERGDYGALPAECRDCHQDDYDEATNPNHVVQAFPTTCAECHATAAWAPAAGTAHLVGGSFPLEGGHVGVACTSCHEGGDYENASTECQSCHRDDYDTSAHPAHAAERIPLACASCHTTAAWTPAPVAVHAPPGAFPLTGAHTEAGCGECHTNGDYGAVPGACRDCHRDDYDGSADPAHAVERIPLTCADCHTTAAWKPQPIAAHAPAGAFPLAGAHTEAGCGECHTNGNYGAVPGACRDCHQDDYDGTTAPNHLGQAFPTTCAECHSTADWRPASGLAHRVGGAFPLDGAHQGAPCASCHVDGQYREASTECQSCHRDDYDTSARPAHAVERIPLACADCHTTAAWKPQPIAAHTPSGAFPLTGGHTATGCGQCHTDGNYGALPSTCRDCHQDDYDGTTAPDHMEQAFPTTCAECHATAGWRPASGIAHRVGGAFPLDGAHQGAACASCHVDGQYREASTECQSCHRDDYDTSARPAHAVERIPLACADCHTTAAWKPQPIAAHTPPGAFPLTGAHIATGCGECHTDGNYGALPSTCRACHQDDYDGTTNPDHGTQAFPTTCANCHATTGWRPASGLAHLVGGSFPLEGGHVGVACASCHLGGDYGSASPACQSCHRDDYDTTTNPPHVPLVLPLTCATCHTTAAWQPADYASRHRFPLRTGKHFDRTCSDCHLPGRLWQDFSCIDCHDHSQLRMDDKHLGEVVNYRWATAACYECHPVGAVVDNGN